MYVYLTNGSNKKKFAIGLRPFAIAACFSGNMLGFGINTKIMSRIYTIMRPMKNGLFEKIGILNGLATLKATTVVTN